MSNYKTTFSHFRFGSNYLTKRRNLFLISSNSSFYNSTFLTGIMKSGLMFKLKMSVHLTCDIQRFRNRTHIQHSPFIVRIHIHSFKS
ncbi:hypothetical protein X975_01759, partial [Stegodyphus mimosarum]